MSRHDSQILGTKKAGVCKSRMMRKEREAVGRYAVKHVKTDLKHDRTTKVVAPTKEIGQTRGSAYKAQQMCATNSVPQFMLE